MVMLLQAVLLFFFLLWITAVAPTLLPTVLKEFNDYDINDILRLGLMTPPPALLLFHFFKSPNWFRFACGKLKFIFYVISDVLVREPALQMKCVHQFHKNGFNLKF